MANNKDSSTSNTLQAALLNSLKQHAEKTAFSFDGTRFSYEQLLANVCQLQSLFVNANEGGIKSIGIITNNDFDTYSAIITSLISGITYIPLEPSHPGERNNYIIELSGLESIYCSDTALLDDKFREQHLLKFLSASKELTPAKEPSILSSNLPAYILFTSGTTGVPKGVSITVENLDAFADNIDKIGIIITDKDRFLQVINLTFDLSVISWLIPLLHGASVYTAPDGPLKYMAAVQLIEDNAITHITTVPSFISYLEPYFKEISLPSVKYWLFSGEAVKTRLVQGWQKCVPGARVFNVYGPTEATVFCSSYRCQINTIKDHNGVVCIGKPFENTFFALFNEGNCISESGISGELCIAGRQLTKGYLGANIKNKEAFFEYNEMIYYRTGDICSMDADGDYFFEGRNDSQIKLDGYRIELGEIENAALNINGITNAVALAVNERGSLQIILFLAGNVLPGEMDVREYLKNKIPPYMMPRKFIFIESVPLNLNGKIDKASLLDMYQQNVS